jgi:hypothetical protein
LNDTSSDFTIKVCGIEGLKFSGHYSIMGTKALPEPINAHGVIPMEYRGKGAIALCNFRTNITLSLVKGKPLIPHC